MTQPVYSPEVLERFLDDVAPLGLPVLVGLLPLASHRNAEFLHNEVPGMQVPEAIRERMRKAGTGRGRPQGGRRHRARDAPGGAGPGGGGLRDAPVRALRAGARSGRRFSGRNVTRRRRRGPGAALAVAVAVAGGPGYGACHRASPEGETRTDGATATAADAQAAVLPARCAKTDVAFAIDEGHGVADLEVGDAIAYPGGYAVGFVHRAEGGPVAAIALLGSDPIGLTRVLELGPTMGDAPPPRIAWRAGELVAAAYVTPETKGGADAATAAKSLPRGESTRDVAIYAIAAGSTSLPPLAVAQRRDDSLALDLAIAGSAGLLVWDEATSAPRGVVKAAAFTRDHVASARDVSPPDSDAESPRVVPQGNGFVVIWIARHPEPASGVDGAVAEATGEARSFGWLEMIAVDAQGAPTGPVRRLTSPVGHVSAYDVEARGPSGAAGPPSLLVVARDDGESIDGSGGALLRVRVTGDAVEPAAVVPTESLGRGAPSFVSGAGAEGPSAPAAGALALAWVAGGEQARLVPLDAAGAPTAPPSAEDALGDARALLFTGRAARAPGGGAAPDALDVLVATPSDSAAQLRVFACSR